MKPVEEKVDPKLILARIKKLMKHAESAKGLGSLEEAEAFSAKATQLLEKYNLSIYDIDLEKDDKEFEKYMYGEHVPYMDNQAGTRWRLNLVNVLTKHNFCNYTWNSHRKTFRIYGRMENVDTCVWLYNFLSVGLMRLAQESHVNRDFDSQIIYGSNRYGFLKDFLIGAVSGIDSKLIKQKRESENASQVRALVLVNKEALDRFLKQANPDVKEKKSRIIYTGPAWHKGFEAGENYSINPPLKNTTTPKKKELT